LERGCGRAQRRPWDPRAPRCRPPDRVLRALRLGRESAAARARDRASAERAAGRRSGAGNPLHVTPSTRPVIAPSRLHKISAICREIMARLGPVPGVSLLSLWVLAAQAPTSCFDRERVGASHVDGGVLADNNAKNEKPT